MIIRRNRTQKILTFSLLFLFIWFYNGITMFYHSHNAYGFYIIHSHPVFSIHWNKGEKKSHTHTPSAYNLIQQINTISWDNDLSLPETPALDFHPISFARTNIPQNIISDFVFTLSLRAPPQL